MKSYIAIIIFILTCFNAKAQPSCDIIISFKLQSIDGPITKIKKYRTTLPHTFADNYSCKNDTHKLRLGGIYCDFELEIEYKKQVLKIRVIGEESKSYDLGILQMEDTAYYFNYYKKDTITTTPVITSNIQTPSLILLDQDENVIRDTNYIYVNIKVDGFDKLDDYPMVYCDSNGYEMNDEQLFNYFVFDRRNQWLDADCLTFRTCGPQTDPILTCNTTQPKDSIYVTSIKFKKRNQMGEKYKIELKNFPEAKVYFEIKKENSKYFVYPTYSQLFIRE
jgi:hypothetical protein